MQFRAIRYFRDDWKRITVVLFCLAGANLLSVLWPIPLAVLIDTVLTGKTSDNWLYRATYALMPANDKVKQIIFLATAMAVIRVLSSLLQTIQTFVNIRIGYNGQVRVRGDLFSKLQALSLAYHRSQPQGDAIYRLSSDTNGFAALLNGLVGTLSNVVMLISIAWVMFTFNWKLTLVALSVVPLLIVTIRSYGALLKRRYAEAYQVDTELTTAIQRSVSSIGLVQAFGRELDEFARFNNTVGKNVKVRMRLHLDEVLYWLILGLILGVGGAVITGYGGLLVYRGQLQIGMLTGFLFFLDRLYDPLNKLSASGTTFAGANTQVRRVFDVLDLDPVIKDSTGAVHLARQPRTLRFDHVSFEYRPGEPVVQDIDVTIAPGQMVAFVGSSGVGKTTLLNLLPRFYDPTEGALKLDDHDARHIKVADLRRHVALVLQDNVILPTTVAENISYGRPDATDAQIHRAAEMSGAASFIEKLPQRYETQITESGSNLSGGQRQRIGIARALITEAPIIVLDEPTSALDPQHEQMITETLKSLKAQRTIVLVSHRLSTVADCDQIFVMDQGKIVERGTHDALIAQRGLYFSMAKHQMKLKDEVATTPT
ncbi:MAG: ABC transporter ATP-binding protein [Anaerolineae bacterium]|nr:ABC transporter ATP-binding protein [Phycisphaerae bacterium]